MDRSKVNGSFDREKGGGFDVDAEHHVVNADICHDGLSFFENPSETRKINSRNVSGGEGV